MGGLYLYVFSIFGKCAMPTTHFPVFLAHSLTVLVHQRWILHHTLIAITQSTTFRLAHTIFAERFDDEQIALHFVVKMWSKHIRSRVHAFEHSTKLVHIVHPQTLHCDGDIKSHSQLRFFDLTFYSVICSLANRHSAEKRITVRS